MSSFPSPEPQCYAKRRQRPALCLLGTIKHLSDILYVPSACIVFVDAQRRCVICPRSHRWPVSPSSIALPSVFCHSSSTVSLDPPVSIFSIMSLAEPPSADLLASTQMPTVHALLRNWSVLKNLPKTPHGINFM